MTHGHIDYRVGWIAAGVAAAGMIFLAADIAIKHSDSTANNNTVASAQSAGAQMTQSDPKVDTRHPTQTQ
jgi:hypothetical protein